MTIRSRPGLRVDGHPALESPMRAVTHLGSGWLLAPLCVVGYVWLRRTSHRLARYLPATVAAPSSSAASSTCSGRARSRASGAGWAPRSRCSPSSASRTAGSTCGPTGRATSSGDSSAAWPISCWSSSPSGGDRRPNLPDEAEEASAVSVGRLLDRFPEARVVAGEDAAPGQAGERLEPLDRVERLRRVR